MLYRLLAAATALLLSSLNLAGCATMAPATPPPDTLWRDQAFALTSPPPDALQAMAVSPAMRTYLSHELAPLIRQLGPRQGLAKALIQPGNLKLEYDAAMTRTAAQAFEARSGNCLSLVLMTAALAHELGLDVQYQEVRSEEQWSRVAGLYVSSGHVNVTLGRRLLNEPRGYDAAQWLTIDFLPPQDLQNLRVRPLNERTVLAMFLNNRAAEALTRRDLNDAYAHVRAAIQQDPGYLAAYNTLSVVYLQHDDPQAAEASLRYLLASSPQHGPALANLVLALRQQGRESEAEQVVAELRRVEGVAPFQFYELGVAALKAGDAGAARDWFRKELARDPDYHEFHFGLAQAELKLGHADEARKQLALAVANSTQRTTRDLYAAKLERLRRATDPSMRKGEGAGNSEAPNAH